MDTVSELQNHFPHYLLSALSGRIADEAYYSLTDLDGFKFPNDEISVIQIASIVDEASFPTQGLYDYAYAINACRQDGLRALDQALLLAASAIFLYCNKREPLGAPHECEFYRNLISCSMGIGDRQLMNACVNFVRELSMDLDEHSSRQECFSGVALAFILRIAGMSETEIDFKVIDIARRRMHGARAHHVTLLDHELEWWRSMAERLIVNGECKISLQELIPAM